MPSVSLLSALVTCLSPPPPPRPPSYCRRYLIPRLRSSVPSVSCRQESLGRFHTYVWDYHWWLFPAYCALFLLTDVTVLDNIYHHYRPLQRASGVNALRQWGTTKG